MKKTFLNTFITCLLFNSTGLAENVKHSFKDPINDIHYNMKGTCKFQETDILSTDISRSENDFTLVITTKENIKEIPTLGKQRERNKAFSANITKRTLLLESNYEIPPLEIFKEFIKEFSNNDNNINFIYDSIFLIDSVLGMGYTQIIELFLKSKKNIIIRGDMLIVAVNKKLFARFHYRADGNN